MMGLVSENNNYSVRLALLDLDFDIDIGFRLYLCSRNSVFHYVAFKWWWCSLKINPPNSMCHFVRKLNYKQTNHYKNGLCKLLIFSALAGLCTLLSVTEFLSILCFHAFNIAFLLYSSPLYACTVETLLYTFLPLLSHSLSK